MYQAKMELSLPCEPLLETLLAVSEEAVVSFDLAGVIVLWNAAATQLYGFVESEVLGKHVSMLLPLYEAPAMDECLRGAHLMEHCAWDNVERLGKDGRLIPMRIQRAPVRGSNGETLGLVEKATELPLGAPRTAAETHLRLLVEQMPVAFWTSDLKLQITSNWGSGFRRLGVFRGKPLGQTVYEYLGCSKREATPVKQHVDALQGVSSRFEYRRRKRVFDISLAPLRDAEGAIIGCIGVALDITERKKTEEQIRYQAAHDGLTGLGNYREFLERLEGEVKRVERSHRSFGLILLDLDELKKINDRFGHLAGNRALKRLARVMRDHCRTTDVAARYGGDEFALLMIDADRQMAEHVAERIANCLRQQSDAPPLSVSIGISVYPDDGCTAHDLLEAADQRLYGRKKAVALPPRGAEGERTQESVPALRGSDTGVK